MKKFVYLFLFFTTICFSQFKNGTIEYKIILENDKELENGYLKDYYKNAKENSSILTFVLNFDTEKMNFFLKDDLASSNKNKGFILAFSGVQGYYYKEKKEDYLYCKISDNKYGSLIVKYNKKLVWNLTKESKLINDFLCFKATTVIELFNDTKKFTRTITAWYCPKIPIPFGPKEYNGLPGLILELHENKAIFAVKTLKFNLDNAKAIEKPSKGKIVTEAEYSSIIQESIGNHSH